MSLSRVSLVTVLRALVAGALIASPTPLSYAAAPPPATVPAPTACGRDTEAAWAPASTRFGEAAGYHPRVGNGCPGHRVPATGVRELRVVRP
ncbi:hypothetical protein ACWD6R_09045 [Streptomyces sp. NPDC005151]